MKYYSLNRQSPMVDFREATIKGQAPDKGLYFPERIPRIDPAFFKTIETIPDDEIGVRVMIPYTETVIPENELHRIVSEAMNFPIPLVKVTKDIYSLELFHGPTLAFKDVGARFMSRCLGYFSKGKSEKITVLVATSGDTGGAVANGFYGVDGVDVVILYPFGKVSSVQEKQLTTLGKNIRALAIEGTFDDCQKMVKQAFADTELNKKLFLTSANSINVARWLPQQLYYFLAYKQWKQINDEAPIISVPSGNFGNVCAGLLAHISGLPVKHFIAACNANKVVPEFLATQEYKPQKAIATISNAMDVGDPSNFVRILELFNKDFLKIKNVLSSYSLSDEETKAIIADLYSSEKYLPDPHGAVGYLGLKKYLKESMNKAGLFLETAHPVKFYDIVELLINSKIPFPQQLNDISGKHNFSFKMKDDFSELKEFLLEMGNK
ncbi:MAG: threonine synthase [Bacteroidetes bacterium]|nr:threonine synthase [Bacteroidota bacterium]